MYKKTIVVAAFFMLGSAVVPAANSMEETVTNDSGLSSMYGLTGDEEIYSIDNIEIRPQQQESQQHEPSRQALSSKNNLHKKQSCQQQATSATNSPAYTNCHQKLETDTKIIKKRLLLHLGKITILNRPSP